VTSSRRSFRPARVRGSRTYKWARWQAGRTSLRNPEARALVVLRRMSTCQGRGAGAVNSTISAASPEAPARISKRQEFCAEMFEPAGPGFAPGSICFRWRGLREIARCCRRSQPARRRIRVYSGGQGGQYGRRRGPQHPQSSASRRSVCRRSVSTALMRRRWPSAAGRRGLHRAIGSRTTTSRFLADVSTADRKNLHPPPPPHPRAAAGQARSWSNSATS